MNNTNGKEKHRKMKRRNSSHCCNVLNSIRRLFSSIFFSTNEFFLLTNSARENILRIYAKRIGFLYVLAELASTIHPEKMK